MSIRSHFPAQWFSCVQQAGRQFFHPRENAHPRDRTGRSSTRRRDFNPLGVIGTRTRDIRRALAGVNERRETTRFRRELWEPAAADFRCVLISRWNRFQALRGGMITAAVMPRVEMLERDEVKLRRVTGNDECVIDKQ